MTTSPGTTATTASADGSSSAARAGLGPIAAVVIGRNEGDRLLRAIEAVMPQVDRTVYVDSRSTDGSPERVRELGCDVVTIDEGPLSATRARCLGVASLRAGGGADVADAAESPESRGASGASSASGEPGEPGAILFLDGDCILTEGWVDRAAAALAADERVGAVVGRRLEEARDDSAWTAVCDVDWELPAGSPEVLGGGDALIRGAALDASGGWPTHLIAGEDLVLSARLREAGWSIHRLDGVMVHHDIGIRSARAFWRRSYRTGYAYAAAAIAAPASGLRTRWMRRSIGMVLYGGALPLVAVAAVIATAAGAPWWVAAVGLALFLLLPVRLVASSLRQSRGVGLSLQYAGATVLSKVAGALGVLRRAAESVSRREAALIEYRPTTPSGAEPPSDG